MASVFDRIRDVLSGSRDGLLPSTQTFPPIDIAQMARELKVGTQFPSCDSSELNIRSALEEQIRSSTEAFRAQLELYDGRIRRASIAAELATEIQTAGEGALATFKVQTLDEQNHLQQLREDLAGHDAEFRQFRDTHRLQRLPRDVPPGAMRLRVALLVLFVALETILNGVFFAQGSELGLIGGVTEALVLALFNVGGAVLYGVFGAPLLVHRGVAWKSAGLVALAAYLFWLLALNLLIVHYRDLFTAANGVVAAPELMRQIASDPFGVAETRSWVLGLLGVAFSIATLIDVLGMRDPYPGYARIARQRRDALHRYSSAVSDTLREFEATRDSAVSDMTGVVASIRDSQYDLELSLAGRARLIENLKAFLEHAAQAFRELIAMRDGRTGASTEWIRMPTIEPVPAHSKHDSDVAAGRMEELISRVNAHYVAAADAVGSSRSVILHGT